MIKLYHSKFARSFRVLWALEEFGQPYELEVLPFPPRFLAKEYLKVNPLGTIPFMTDGDTHMTESAAICEFLAARYGKAPIQVQADEAIYGAYLNWLDFGEATLTFPQTIVFRYTKLEPEPKRNPQVAADYKRWFLKRLCVVETALQNADYLCGGDRFTMADVSVGYALMLAKAIGIDEDFSPVLRDYCARLKERDAYKRARAAERDEQGKKLSAV